MIHIQAGRGYRLIASGHDPQPAGGGALRRLLDPPRPPATSARNENQAIDVILYTYPGETVPHHVVIYLGSDTILEAPQTGENVRYGTLSEFPGQTARVRRITQP